MNDLELFVKESNKIEGISCVIPDEIVAHTEFLTLQSVTIPDLAKLVRVLEPGAKLRDKPGMNVRIGSHTPPPGGPEIVTQLGTVLLMANGCDVVPWTPYDVHHAYETLHPFSDGNGRSGRALWAWQMLKEHRWPGLGLGFLHAFYYQCLSERNHSSNG